MCVGSTCTTSRTKPRLDVTVYEPRMTVEAPGVSGSRRGDDGTDDRRGLRLLLSRGLGLLLWVVVECQQGAAAGEGEGHHHAQHENRDQGSGFGGHERSSPIEIWTGSSRLTVVGQYRTPTPRARAPSGSGR